MVADAIEDDRGSATEARDPGAHVGFNFELDEHGRVWMMRQGDFHIIGRKDAVCAEMRRFLAAVVLGISVK
jgi:hypothetical protein